MDTLNNPFFVLEKAWQACPDNRQNGIESKTDLSYKMQNTDSGDSVQSHFGSEDRGFHAHATGQYINLSSICISTIFQIEDDHLPGPLLKIYAHCLQKGRVDPQDKQNAATLRLCNYLFKKWHDTRAKLNFIRDTMKIILAFARRFSDNVVHVDRAIDSCPIGKYRVWTTLLHQLKKETGGMNLGDYLSRHEGGVVGNDFCGLTFNLFDRADVMAAGENDGYFSRLMVWPGLSYARQVVLHLVRNIYKLNRLSSSATGSDVLFEECVPSWAEEKRRHHSHNDPAYNEDRQLRNDILASLLNSHVPSASGPDSNSPPDHSEVIAKRQKNHHGPQPHRQITAGELGSDKEIPSSKSATLFSADKSRTISFSSTSGGGEEEDLTSIDTRSFRHAMGAARGHMMPETHVSREQGLNAQDGSGEALAVNLLFGRNKSDSVMFFDALPPSEMLDNESKLNTLLTHMPPQLTNTVIYENALPGSSRETATLFEIPVMPETTPSTRLPLMIENEKNNADDNDSDVGNTRDTVREPPVPAGFDASQNPLPEQGNFSDDDGLLYGGENDNDDEDDGL